MQEGKIDWLLRLGCLAGVGCISYMLFELLRVLTPYLF